MKKADAAPRRPLTLSKETLKNLTVRSSVRAGGKMGDMLGPVRPALTSICTHKGDARTLL